MSEEQKCKIHPQYKGIREPTSQREGCTCREIWEAKQQEVEKEEEARQQKIDEIIDAYSDIARERGYVSMNDMVDAGYTKDTVVHYFRNLARLNKAAREKNPDSFFDKYISDILGQENLDKLHDAVCNHKRLVVTTAITGCKANDHMISSIKNYCRRNNAHCLVLVASDPAHNRFSPGATYGTIDRQLVDDPDISVVVSDTALNSNLYISTVKLSAKHIDPSTSMGRIASKNGTFIFASPKQRLKAVPVSNEKFPHFTMTTGAITAPDYSTTNYMSGRQAFIAEHDHVMGGLIVEVVDDEKYHFRQFQADDSGAITDLGVRYTHDGGTEYIQPEAFVLGDWHCGVTDPSARLAWQTVCELLAPKRLVLHDTFDGLSINHHEREDVVQRAIRALAGQHNLKTEMEALVEDINELCDWVDDEVVLVKSNHDEVLDRYLRTGYYVKDPENHRYALDLAAAAMDDLDPLRYAVENIGINDPDKVRWLDRDDDYKVAGIQLGAHGDLGANGARGGIKNIEQSYGNSVTGHAHTPEILRGAWQVGTSSYLKLNYNRGPSSWMHSSCLVYPDGSRQLINSVNGDWVLEEGLYLFS